MSSGMSNREKKKSGSKRIINLEIKVMIKKMMWRRKRRGEEWKEAEDGDKMLMKKIVEC